VSTFHVEFGLANTLGDRWENVDALVETAAAYSWIPSDVLERLGVHPIERRRFQKADGTLVEYDIGEVKVRLIGREWHDLVVFREPGRPALLGRLTLDCFSLGVDEANQRLIEVPALA
jgi:predicted aspartyl protease